MRNCNHIQTLIDGADKPDVLPYAATRHLAACQTCQTFADERTKLRALLNTMPRVNAPANFDTRLQARLAGTKIGRPFSWFGAAFILRFGAVASAVLILTFVVQYGGSLESAPMIAGSAVAGNYVVNPSFFSSNIDKKKDLSASEPSGIVAVANRTAHSHANKGSVLTPRSIKEFAVDGNPIIIVNDDKETFSMPMLPVSVGAQQQMMMRSTRPAVKSPAVSF